MEGLELICFEMIAYHGCARSHFIEAIRAAKQGDFAAAEAKMAEGEKDFQIGHRAHAQLIQKEAGGEELKVSLLLLHAADLMMSAETLKIMAQELIDLYKAKGVGPQD
ncbi:MAG: PTS lactose/cellobiose transporter subunit IIA [Bacillota bacterium]|jgi:PTS system cellobiose-specific IIA component